MFGYACIWPQGKGQCLKNWSTFSIMLHKIKTSVDCNYWVKQLNTQLNEPTNQNSIKVPKVVRLTNKKTLL